MVQLYVMFKAVKDRYMSEKAQGMVEYALIIAFVVAIAIALSSDGGLSGAIKGVFSKASSQITTNTNVSTT